MVKTVVTLLLFFLCNKRGLVGIVILGNEAHLVLSCICITLPDFCTKCIHAYPSTIQNNDLDQKVVLIMYTRQYILKSYFIFLLILSEVRTSAYLLRQLPQIKLVHTGLETPLFSHYFLSVHPFLAFFRFLFACLFFNLSPSSLFLTLIPPFHIYLLSPYPTW